jgi:large subunit ribosomal protein L18
MSKRTKRDLRRRRQMRVRHKISGTADRPRLAVFRSAKHVQVQLIDDTTGHALLGLASYSPSVADEVSAAEGKCARSHAVGKALAAKAAEAGIKEAVFDRGGYLYHGRVKALAEGAREGGLKI